jgi:four helix bundle protein
VSISSDRDLDCWRLGIDGAKLAYSLTKSLPREEAFGLTAQIRRAAVAIPANIAEGHGRESTADFIRFLRIAQGSVKELETHLIIAIEVGLLAGDHASPLQELCDRQGRMLRALIRSLDERVKT